MGAVHGRWGIVPGTMDSMLEHNCVKDAVPVSKMQLSLS